jgi:hypothetical protein
MIFESDSADWNLRDFAFVVFTRLGVIKLRLSTSKPSLEPWYNRNRTGFTISFLGYSIVYALDRAEFKDRDICKHIWRGGVLWLDFHCARANSVRSKGFTLLYSIPSEMKCLPLRKFKSVLR